MVQDSGWGRPRARVGVRVCVRVRVRAPTPRVGGRLVVRACGVYICGCEKIYGISSLRFPNPESRFWKEETGEIEWAERGSQRGSVRMKKACVLMLYTLKKKYRMRQVVFI